MFAKISDQVNNTSVNKKNKQKDIKYDSIFGCEDNKN